MALVQALVMLVTMICTAIPAGFSVAAASAEDACRELIAEMYADSTYTELLDTDTEILLSGALPEGAAVKAYPVEYAIADSETVAAYDITIFEADGETVFEPADGNISVKFSVPGISALPEHQLEVYHIAENGSEQKIETVVAEGDSVSFDAESFSVYVIINHEGEEEIVTPRVEFHFINYEYELADETTGTYSASPYSFRNKGVDQNGQLGVQTSQIVQDGETLEAIENPPNTETTFFYGWYIVRMLSDENGTILYQWEDDPVHIDFEKPIGVSLDGNLTTWTYEGKTMPTALADADGCAHIYLAPLYSNYYFVNFHVNDDYTDEVPDTTLLTRRLIPLGANNLAHVRIGNLVAPTPDAKHLVFTGWETVDSEGNQVKKYLTLDADGMERDVYLDFDENGNEVAITRPDGYEPGYYIPCVEEDVDLYPIFNEARWLYFDVGSNGNGASYVESKYLLTNDDNSGTYFEHLPISQRKGYNFKGWYADAYKDPETGEYHFENAVQITDENGNVLNTNYVKRNENLEPMYEIRDGALYAYKALPASETQDGLTLYAKWEEKADSSYTVIIWKQKVTDDKSTADDKKTYDYEKSLVVENVRTGTTLEQVVNHLESTGEIKEGNNQKYTGFHYRTSTMNAAGVTGDGRTVVDVYYDRNLQTIQFVGYPTYTATTGTSDTFGYLNEVYFPLAKRNYYNYYYYLSYNNEPYVGTVYAYSNRYGYYAVDSITYNNTYYGDINGYARELTWKQYSGQRYTRTQSNLSWNGLYEQTFAQNGYSWDQVAPFRWIDGGNVYQTFLDSFIQSENPYVLNYVSSAPKTSPIYHYRQQLDGSYTIDDRETAYGNGGTFNFSNKYTGFTVSACSSPDFSATASGRTPVTDGDTATEYPLHVYHTRNPYELTFNVNYPDDISVHFSTEKAQSKKETLLFEAPLNNFSEGAEDYYDLTNNAPDHYIFTGWYEDETATVLFDFNSTMPAANKIIYAGWKKIEYRVDAEPNGGEIDHIDHTAEIITVRNERTGVTASYRTFRPEKGTYNKDQATYFLVEYNEPIGEYGKVDRNYIEISDSTAEELGTDKVYYYIDTPYLDTDGRSIPADLRNALYVKESELREYHRYYVDVLNAYKTIEPEKYANTQILTDFEVWKHYYVADQKYALLSDVSSNQKYVLLGWYQVDENGDTETMPFDFTTPATGEIKLKALWRLDGGYKLWYVSEYRTASNVVINGNMQHYDDPPNEATFADQARATVFRQPVGITADGTPTDEYIFRGWRLVKRVNDTTYIPLENNVYYQPGDQFIVHAIYADNNSNIYMQAVYERKDVAYRRPEIANLTLDANGGYLTNGTPAASNQDLPAQLGQDIALPWYEDDVCTVGTKLKDTSPATEYDQIVFGNMQSNAAVHLYHYATTIDPEDENKETGVNYFAHEEKYMLLGFDKAPNENDYIASFPADSVISVQRTDNTTLYAVWEPLVYLNFENKTDKDITFALTADDAQTLYVVNEKTSVYDRVKVEDNSSITVKAMQNGTPGELHLAIPFGAAQNILIKGKNELGIGKKLSVTSYLGEEKRNAVSVNNGEVYSLPETLVTDSHGIDVVFEPLKQQYALLLIDCDDPAHGRDTGTHEIDFSADELDSSFELSETRANIGYIFQGWSNTDSSANISEAPEPNYVSTGDEHDSIPNLRQFFTENGMTETVNDGQGNETIVRKLYAVWKVNNEADMVFVYKDAPLPGNQAQQFNFTVSMSFDYKFGNKSQPKYNDTASVRIAHGEYFKIVAKEQLKQRPHELTLTITKYNKDQVQVGDAVTLGVTGTTNDNMSYSNLNISVTEDNYPHYNTEITQISSTAAQGFSLRQTEHSISWTNMNTGGSVLFTNTRKTRDITIQKLLVDPKGYVSDKEFEFELELDDNDPDYTYTLPASEFSLMHNETRKISGVPVGATLRIRETGDVSSFLVKAESAGGYTDRSSEDNVFSYTVPDADDTITFTNELKSVRMQVFSVDEELDTNGQYKPYTGAIYQIAGLTGDLIPAGDGLIYTDDTMYYGTYVITETWTSEGYVRLNTPVHITISASGVTSDHPDVIVEQPDETHPCVIRIVNHKFKMPAPTGFEGEEIPFGLLFFAMSGLFGAAVYLFRRKAGDDDAI